MFNGGRPMTVKINDTEYRVNCHYDLKISDIVN